MVYGVSNDGLAIVLAIIGVGGPIGLAILFQLLWMQNIGKTLKVASQL